MRSRHVVAAALGAVFAGCNQAPQFADPKLVPSDWKECRGTKCDVHIKNIDVSSGTCNMDNSDVDPAKLALVGGGSRKIVWHLQGNFRFCQTRGDGVFITGDDVYSDDPSVQFGLPVYTDRDDGDPDPSNPEKCKKKVSLTTQNTGGNTYKYEIQFHLKDKRVRCRLDPWVKNG